MNTVTKNVLAVVVGLVVGNIVNFALVKLGHSLFPLPEGTDIFDQDQMREAMKSFTTKDFIFPFLAHAIGTLVGAFLAAKLAGSHAMKLALGVGIFFLLGGISAVAMYGGPLWFKVVDLTLAYLPMGYLGGKLGGQRGSSS